jgi:single-stranded DNA-binding protein
MVTMNYMSGRQGRAAATSLADGRRVGIVGQLASSVWRDGSINREQVCVTAFSVDCLVRAPRRRPR